MSSLPSPAAARLPRARWLDTRLVVGVLLMLVSVAVGTKTVAAADRTVPVWAVTSDAGPGTKLTSEMLVREQVHLDGHVDRYVSADEPLPAGYVLTRSVGRGELLPAAAVATSADASLRRLPLAVDPVALAGVHDHAVVDVYVVPASRTAGGESDSPRSRLVVAGVTVDEVQQRTGGIAASGVRADGVVLLVRPGSAQQILDAQAQGSLRLLEVPGAPAGSKEAGRREAVAP